MKNMIFGSTAALLIAVSLIFPYSASGQGLSESLRAAVNQDTVRNVWVFFKDRPERGNNVERVTDKAALRRRNAGFNSHDGDRPVSRRYIAEIERRGGVLRHVFDWGNAASFSVHTSHLNEIALLPFVDSVSPVAVYIRKDIGDRGVSRLGRSASAASYQVPGYDWHMDMVNIPLAHEYLAAKGRGVPGSGVLMAFFDSGFRLDHRAFDSVIVNGQIRATYDFVDNDETVYDPDSVANVITHPYHASDEHGTNVLGFVAGNHPGVYMGAAWGADFALARTEDMVIEARVEEDNWAAAVVWAESLGVDIISSSLGYRDGFDNANENYVYRNMDGKTTVIAKAAAGAVERGVIVVTSMGNEGRSGSSGTLTSPADVDGAVAVGAVDQSGVLASYSSTGPTYDGRIKPDVAAPGSWVRVVDPYGSHSEAYRGASGTSMSTPIVSGILALILQANPGISAEEARERLYRTCAFAPRQTHRDNGYGYGIPNALRAMMGEDEIFVKITDAVGVELAGARVMIGANAYDIDSTGNALIDAQGMVLPLAMKVFFRDKEAGSIMVDSLPFAGVAAMDVIRDGGLKVSPTMVRRSSVVKGRYLFSGLDVSAPAVAAVFTPSGRKVWEQKLLIRPDGTAEFSWDRRGGRGRTPAGVYFVTVRHGHSMVSERIMIAE